MKNEPTEEEIARWKKEGQLAFLYGGRLIHDGTDRVDYQIQGYIDAKVLAEMGSEGSA